MRFTYENVVSNYVRRFQTRVRRRKIGRNRILYNFYGSLCLRIKGPTYSFRGGGLSWPSAGTVFTFVPIFWAHFKKAVRHVENTKQSPSAFGDKFIQCFVCGVGLVYMGS